MVEYYFYYVGHVENIIPLRTRIKSWGRIFSGVIRTLLGPPQGGWGGGLCVAAWLAYDACCIA